MMFADVRVLLELLLVPRGWESWVMSDDGARECALVSLVLDDDKM